MSYAIVFAGGGGKGAYQIGVLKALKDLGYKILVCDKNKEKIREFDNTINDYRDIPDNYTLVLISTPPNTHCEIIKYLNSVGKTIICEKPLVVSMEELDSIENKYEITIDNSLKMMIPKKNVDKLFVKK